MKSLPLLQSLSLLKPLVEGGNKFKMLTLILIFILPVLLLSQEQLHVIPDNSYTEVGKMRTGMNQKDKWIERAKKLGATHYYVESSITQVENYLNEAGRSATFKGAIVRFYKKNKRLEEYWEKYSEAVNKTKQRNKKWFRENGVLYCEVTNGYGKFISKCAYSNDSILNGPCKTQKIKLTRRKEKKQVFDNRLGIWEERDVVYDDGDIILGEYTIANYVNGIKNGTFVEYNKNGIKKAEGKYVNGKIDGIYLTYKSDGATIYEKKNYVNGLLKGPYTKYSSDSKISEQGNYANGKLEGPYLIYHENGKIKKRSNYTKGRQEREYTIYHKNGNVKERSSKESYVKYFANGNIEEIHNYNKDYDFYNGSYAKYSMDGKIINSWKLARGKKVGVFKILDKEGRIAEEGFKEGNDTIVKEYEYFTKKRIESYKLKDFDYSKPSRVRVTKDGWLTYTRYDYYPSGNLCEKGNFIVNGNPYALDSPCGETIVYKDQKKLKIKNIRTSKIKCPKTD